MKRLSHVFLHIPDKIILSSYEKEMNKRSIIGRPCFFSCGRSQGKNKGLGIEPTAGSGGKNSLSAPVVALIKGQISF